MPYERSHQLVDWGHTRPSQLPSILGSLADLRELHRKQQAKALIHCQERYLLATWFPKYRGSTSKSFLKGVKPVALPSRLLFLCSASSKASLAKLLTGKETCTGMVRWRLYDSDPLPCTRTAKSHAGQLFLLVTSCPDTAPMLMLSSKMLPVRLLRLLTTCSWYA